MTPDPREPWIIGRSAPQDVRLHMPSGEVYHLDHTLHYLGIHNGMHRWNVYGPPGMTFCTGERRPVLHVRVLPGKTAIALPFVPGPVGALRFAPDPRIDPQEPP